MRSHFFLRDLVFLDGLTGLYNRRYFDQQLARELTRSVRQNSTTSLILLDVDFFKRYNDHYGHQAGDDCLREIARLIKTSLKRSTDIVARYGGEEFVCLLPDTDHLQALQLAEDIEQRVRLRGLPHAFSDAAKVVTISLGVASGTAQQAGPHALLTLADEQLYKAKSEGRARALGATLGSPGTP